eukprot:scaffold6428_cov332-Prasinococcus_capsulatus_cf.AAC.5
MKLTCALSGFPKAAEDLAERWSLLEATLSEFLNSGSGIKFTRSDCGHFVRLNLAPFLDTTGNFMTHSGGGAGPSLLESEFKLWEDMSEVYRVVLWPCGIMNAKEEEAGTFRSVRRRESSLLRAAAVAACHGWRVASAKTNRGRVASDSVFVAGEDEDLLILLLDRLERLLEAKKYLHGHW